MKTLVLFDRKFREIVATLLIITMSTLLTACGGEDGGGNTADTTPPAVSITTPVANATVSGGSVLVSVTAIDASGIAPDVTLKVNGNTYSNNPTGSGPYAFAWNTTGLPNGQYTLQACAHDKSPAANLGCSTNVTVTVNNSVVDNTGPTVSIMFPAVGANVSGTVVLAASASDSGSGVKQVQFKLDGANLGSAITTAPYTQSWNSATTTNGSHTLTVEATDNANNASVSVSVTFAVTNAAGDTTGPTVDFYSPLNNAVLSNTVKLSAIVTDSQSGVDRVVFKMNGTEVGTAVTGMVADLYDLVFNTKLYSDGDYTFTAVAYDKAGNMTESLVKHLTIQNTFVLTTPVMTAYRDTTFTGMGYKIVFNWTYSRNDVISHLEISVNGSPFIEDFAPISTGYPTVNTTAIRSVLPTDATDTFEWRVKNCERATPANCTGYSNLIRFSNGAFF